MYERRRQTASLVSLLVVTSLFVWACSSGGHEDALVTTSGGAGYELRAGTSATPEAEGGAPLGFGGTSDAGSPASLIQAGSAESEPNAQVPEPSAGGEPEVSNGGTTSAGGTPLAIGGTIDINRAGAPGAGAPSAGAPSAGAPSAGAPAVVEPVCDPPDTNSSGGLVLPCDVFTALYVCRNCHTNPPVKGVYTSYMTFADIKPNAAQIYAVIKSGTMPWPPYTMSTWQKTTALKWLGENGTCAIGAAKSCQ